jgi:dTDP-L-rhamnose 4-epimerase
MSGPILVTGGAGFIGSHVVDALLDAGHDVRVLDVLLPAAHRERPEYLDPRAEWIEGDVRDPDTTARAVAGVSAVSHQAAMVGLGTDIGDIADYVAHNDLGTAVLVRALAAARFAGRLVLASSMVIYGEGRYACPEHGVVRAPPRRPADLDAGRFEPPCPVCGAPLEPRSVPEDAPADPRNVYAATKIAQEHLCAAFARETGASYAALRYHNVYGPRMPRDTPYAGVASIFRSALAAGQAPRVFEDGAQRRDFVHVRDVARANQLALHADAEGAFNVASGTPRTVLDMAQALARALGGEHEPIVTGQWRAGDVRHVFASAAAAAARLGFTASEDFDAGMREFAAAPLRA